MGKVFGKQVNDKSRFDRTQSTGLACGHTRHDVMVNGYARAGQITVYENRLDENDNDSF